MLHFKKQNRYHRQGRSAMHACVHHWLTCVFTLKKELIHVEIRET